MFLRTNKRKAISTVLTTMIILVASVVLGTGVVIYGTSLFQTAGQQSAIASQGVKVWVNATDANGIAWGAAGVRNTGDKLISVDKIEIRGATVPFTNWYVDTDPLRVTSENFQSQFNHTWTSVVNTHEMRDTENAGGGSVDVTSQCASDAGAGDNTTIELDLDGDPGAVGPNAGDKPTLCLLQATGPISLSPGAKLIVYFKVPNGVLSSVDSGAATSVSIFAGQSGAPTSVTVGNP